MDNKNIVIVGGGYAGLHAVNHIRKQLPGAEADGYRILLIDKESYHFRKVLLFKAAVTDRSHLKVPFSMLLKKGIEFVQAGLHAIDPHARTINVTYPDGSGGSIPYERLVLTLGSVINRVPEEMGGISLSDPANAEQVRQQILCHLQLARTETRPDVQRELLSAAVVGAGITGIETAAELGFWMKAEAEKAGLDPRLVEVKLINNRPRLFEAGSVRTGEQLEEMLRERGVNVYHGIKARRFEDGKLQLDNGSALPAAVCVWTLGLKPNPLLGRLGLPLDPNGKLSVDPWYHVQGHPRIYAIGDCANIVDPLTGKADGMTCKEAVPQAKRLGQIVKAELQGKTGPQHKPFGIPLYCIGLGPGNGFVWARGWGRDIVLKRSLGWKFRVMAWNSASFIDGKVQKRLHAEQ